MAHILFFTPVLPGITGQGTGIRSGIALELLSEKHEVTVVHIDLWTGDRTIADPFWPRKKAAAYHFLPVPAPPDAAEQLVKKHLSATTFDGVYVFRLVAAPMALRIIGLLGQPQLSSVLDLDDDECARTEKFLFYLQPCGLVFNKTIRTTLLGCIIFQDLIHSVLRRKSCKDRSWANSASGRRRIRRT